MRYSALPGPPTSQSSRSQFSEFRNSLLFATQLNCPLCSRLTGAGVTGSIPTLGGGTGTSVTGLVTLGAPSLSLPPPVQQGKKEAEPSSIAVMTHEKRVYSNKVGH